MHLITASIAFVLVGLTLSTQVRAQNQANSERHYAITRIIADPSLSERWSVIGAGFLWDAQTSWASLTVKNAGREAVHDARFYAEYFDRDKHLNFSAAFVLTGSEERSDTPVEPGESCTLEVSLPSLAPATAPIEIRVYRVEDEGDTFKSNIRSPITVLAWEPPEETSLASAAIDDDNSTGIVNLALAEVIVGVDGRVKESRLVHGRHRSADDVFLRFIEKLRFNPLQIGNEFTTGRTLVLLRLLGEGKYDLAAALSQNDPWVKEYVQSTQSKELPVVNELFFEPRSHWWPQAERNPQAWTFVSLGTDWCPEAIRSLPIKYVGVSRRVWR